MSEEQSLRVVIADDHELVRAGMRGVLSADPRIVVVAEASDGLQAIAATEMHHPDVVVMDLQMPGVGGIEATRRVLASRPGTSVLVVTMFDDDDSVFSAVRAGARGYVLKGASRDELRAAVWGVATGQAVFGPGVAARVMDSLMARPGPAPAFPQLTPRERAVLESMVDGDNPAATSRRLQIAEKTVRNNISSILTKLHVSDRVAAVEAARASGVGGNATPAPSSRRTLLFTDIDGSTQLAREVGDDYRDVLVSHNRLIDTAVAAAGGTCFGSAGDARFAWFPTDDAAVAAAVEGQRQLARFAFPRGVRVSVRMGIHAGEVSEHDGELVGLALHEAARVAATADGATVVVSADAMPASLPGGVSLRSLGVHDLRDLDRPLGLYRVDPDDRW